MQIDRVLGSYFTYWSYKCYNPHFLHCTVRINVFLFIFSKNSIFHVIKEYFGINPVYWKIKEIFPNSMYNRNLRVIRNITNQGSPAILRKSGFLQSLESLTFWKKKSKSRLKKTEFFNSSNSLNSFAKISGIGTWVHVQDKLMQKASMRLNLYCHQAVERKF